MVRSNPRGVRSLSLAASLIGLLAPDDLTRWLEKWSGECRAMALAAFTGFTLVGNPFTFLMPKKRRLAEYWDSPIFLSINRMITGVTLAP